MLLTVRDVEAELQLGRTRTYELLRSGVIPVVRVGRVLRVPRDGLRRWIDENCASAKATPTGTISLRGDATELAASSWNAMRSPAQGGA